MSKEMIPFDNTQLPAWLRGKEDVNADLMSHAGGGFPVMSIKGKTFAIVRDGERKMLMNPNDHRVPATYLNVVLLKVNKAKSKVFYLGGYDEKAEQKKPDCFSNDGVKPDPSAENKQSASCATCRHNQWGSRVGDAGQSKGKACADTVRVAMASPDQINEPYLLRVPPASIRALGEYGVMLSKRNVPYQAVITEVSFDMEAPTPKLQFKPVGFLNEAQFREVQQMVDSDIVRNILGSVSPQEAADSTAQVATPVAQPARTKVVTQEEVEQAVQAAVVQQPVQQPAAKPAEEVSLDLDGITFDD